MSTGSTVLIELLRNSKRFISTRFISNGLLSNTTDTAPLAFDIGGLCWNRAPHLQYPSGSGVVPGSITIRLGVSRDRVSASAWGFHRTTPGQDLRLEQQSENFR